jgi:UDP-glucose 4-epimerase
MHIKTVVITGASGRLSQALSQHFSSSSLFKVRLVSTQERAGYFSYEEMLTNEFLHQADIILHLAWSSVPRISEQKFGVEWLQDIPLLVRILKAIGEGHHSHIHLIFFSSAGAIYGNYTETPAREDTPCNPANMYGWAKLHAEQLIEQHSLRFGIPTTVLRITNVYGIGSRRNDQQGVIPYLIKAALDGNEMSIWGDGTARKDYLYINDLIEATDILVKQKALGLFNVSQGSSYSLKEIIAIVEQVSGNKISINYKDAFFGDNTQVVVDSNKIRNTLMWKPRITIAEGVRRTFQKLKNEIF